jgi:transposase
LRLEGLKNEDVAARVGNSVPTVSIWSSRFEQLGLDGLEDKAGHGRKPSIPTKKVERVITEVTRPPKGRRRWSVRSMGRHVGISHSTVQRIWSKSGLKPHVTKTFKLSNDPNFEAKFWVVIGLDLDPPTNALVLCCDEKSQCQALERTQSAAYDDARLHAPRHHQAVCRADRTHRQAHYAHGGEPLACLKGVSSLIIDGELVA